MSRQDRRQRAGLADAPMSRRSPRLDTLRERALQSMSDQAIYAAKLLVGELPTNIEDLFGPGPRFFPAEAVDIRLQPRGSGANKPGQVARLLRRLSLRRQARRRPLP